MSHSKNNLSNNLSVLFNDDLKKKLYAACASTEAPKKPLFKDEVACREEKKTPTAAFAQEMLSNNAKALRQFSDLQSQKDYLYKRINNMTNVTEAKRKWLLYGMGQKRNGVMYARDFNGLLSTLTRIALGGYGYARM